METKSRQSKFYWFIQTFSFFLLVLIVSEQANAVENHNYLSNGERFYLLTDSTYSSDEIAKVRVEYTVVDQKIGGMDIAIYRVNDPIPFLKSQKNLHRVNTKYNYSPYGVVANALRYVWDKFYLQSRVVWQRLIDENVRKNVTDSEPRFVQPMGPSPTKYKEYAQFRPIKGFELLESFRYPIALAKKAEPPVELLEGSSHHFLDSIRSQKNMYVPLGKLKPGMYLVEATLGTHRANTLIFISDTVVVSKISSKQVFTWSANKLTGKASSNAEIIISDGVGVLKQARTDKDGFADISIKVPEQSYIMSVDTSGGVSISDNFYYDSEIYDSKVYVFTDRPLYRPGDKVNIKALSRNFLESNKSVPLERKTFDLLVLDSSSTVLIKDKIEYDSIKGGDFSFKLPGNALPGGHSILLKDKNKTYASEFRVAKYAKPYFNLDIVTTPQRLKLNEEAKSRVILSYFNGAPVKDAEVEVTIRRQKLNVIEGDYDAESLFPVNVEQLKSKTDDKGTAEFNLPAVAEASRYIIMVKAKDSGDFIVSGQMEVSHIEGKPIYEVKSSSSFTKPDETVEFSLSLSNDENGKIDKEVVGWTCLRIDDQKTTVGKGSGKKIGIKISESGTYRINFLNASGISLGRVNHVVVGTELKQTPGSIDITTNKVEYKIGEMAKFLVTTENESNELLVTLEREKVEKFSLGSKGDSWVSAKKISKNQWEVEFEVKSVHAPNMILSALYIKDGMLSFSNKGFKVLNPKIEISFNFDKNNYRPGELVKLKLKSTYLGKAIKSHIVLSVVDEMIYVLQPEIAPSIEDFFYHVRRNQVKTNSTLSFFGYDSSVSVNPRQVAPNSEYEERPMKLRERPRRDEVDTAYFKTLETNGNGDVDVEFILPDSLTKWRFTARAVSSGGEVGQSSEKVLVDKEVYAKWGNISEFRQGDIHNGALVVFNNTNQKLKTDYSIQGAGVSIKGVKEIVPGVNFIKYELEAKRTGLVKVELKGKYTEVMEKMLLVELQQWPILVSQRMNLIAGTNEIDIPKQAYEIKLRDESNLYLNFLNRADDLISYPHGCVEQTSSKLLALSLGYKILSSSGDNKRIASVREMIVQGKEHLASLSQNNARFGWYDHMEADSFITIYAYLADMFASQALQNDFSIEDAAKVNNNYLGAAKNNILQESLMLWLGAQMKQPVQGMLLPALHEIEAKESKLRASKQQNKISNYFMSSTHQLGHYSLAKLLIGLAAKKMMEDKFTFTKKENTQILEKVSATAKIAINDVNLLPRIASAIFLNEKIDALELAFEELSNHYSTIDRALILILSSQYVDEQNKLVKFNISGKDWIKNVNNPIAESWDYRGEIGSKIIIKSDKETKANLTYRTVGEDTHYSEFEVSSNLYNLKKEKKISAVPLEKDEQIEASKIYLLKATIKTNKPISYGLLEIALPPGGQIEKNLADVEVIIAGKPLRINSTYDEKSLSVGIPIRELNKSIELAVPIRFNAKGKFHLPRTRFYQMYLEESKSYEGANKPALKSLNVI